MDIKLVFLFTVVLLVNVTLASFNRLPNLPERHAQIKFNAQSCSPSMVSLFWEQLAIASLPYCQSDMSMPTLNQAWTKIRHAYDYKHSHFALMVACS
jgi:hypothetical protein